MFVTDVPILSYHQITADIPSVNLGFAVSAKQLKHQMYYLYENGYICMSLVDVLRSSDNKSPNSKKTFALTFDDGYENFHTLAYPTLHELGFTATVFLIAGKTFGRNDPKREADKRYLTWEQIEFLQNNNLTFGSHTYSHALLTKLSCHEIQRELVNSKTYLEAGLGQEIRWLAYPHGASNDEIQKMARDVGYQAAFGGSRGRSNQFNIRRQFCLREESILVFAFRLMRIFQNFERLRNETDVGRFFREVKHRFGLAGR